MTQILTDASIGLPNGPAPVTSPVFLGDPKAPTPAPGNNTTSLATTAFAGSADSAVQAFSIQRANHTGTQLAATVSDFAATVRATILTGLSTALATTVAATHTVLEALGFLQKQTTDNLTTLTAHTGNVANPHAVTKAQVGLGNVDNLPATTYATSAQGTLAGTALQPAAIGVSVQGYTAALAAVSGTNTGDTAANPSAMGDGVTTTFLYVGPTVTKTDWQGTTTLVTTARTNYLFQSQNQSSAIYAFGTMTVTAGIADPAGGTNAFTLTAGGAASYIFQSRPAALTPGTYCNSVWIRRRTGTGTVVLYTPAFIGGPALALTSSYQRLFIAGATNAGGDLVWGVNISTSGDAVDIAFGQVEPGSAMTAYIPTTTAAVTVTDLTVAAGLATLSPVPALGVTLRGVALSGPGANTERLNTGKSTVAALPAGSIGMRYFVTDASAPAFGAAVVGGGAVPMKVFHDGVSWKVG